MGRQHAKADFFDEIPELLLFVNLIGHFTSNLAMWADRVETWSTRKAPG
jgi:hypothetical protein